MCGHLIAKLHLRQTSCIWNKRKKRTLRLYITNVLEKYRYVYKRFFKFLEVKYFFLNIKHNLKHYTKELYL